MASVAAMISSVGICLGVTAKFNPNSRTSSSSVKGKLMSFLTTPS